MVTWGVWKNVRARIRAAASYAAEATLTREEIVGVLKLLWAAGIHTTGRLITTSAFLLLRHPHIRAEVQRDLRLLLPPFIEEVLRLDTPELMAWRATREDDARSCNSL